jgi:hypothetical protein
VVAAAGATIVWVWAPASDQEVNAQLRPFSACGEMAPIELLEPSITCRVNGVAPWSPPIAIWRPCGDDSKVRLTVRGSRRRLSVSLTPLESVAVRRISRRDGYS